jgi:hypothetical protein
MLEDDFRIDSIFTFLPLHSFVSFNIAESDVKVDGT